MSTTAVAEPPKTEVNLPPVGEAPTPAQKEGFLKFIREAQSKPKDTVVKDTTVVEVSKQEPVKTEPVKVEPAKTEPVQTDAEKNFAALRLKAEAAEKAAADAAAERDRLKAEYEEYKKKPAPEEFVKRLEATEKEKAEYQKRLREADLSRDPEFNARFDTGIRNAMQQMVDIVAASGVDKKDATAQVATWNENQFAEWMEALGPVEKMKFGAAMQQAISLDSQKAMELAQADQTWQAMQKQRQEAEKTQREQYLGSLRGDIEANLKELAETPLGKDHTEVLEETRKLLLRAGGLEGDRLDNKTLLGMVGKSMLLAKGFERQEKAIAEHTAKIAELQKTLEERDKFIKDLNGATPPISGSLPAAKADRKAAARAILNPVIN